jgi:hypothetical protein
MNQLIAKIRDRSRTNNKLRKVISDEIMFVLPENLDEAIGYDPSTLLEDKEWYVITTFSTMPYCLDFLMDEEFDSVDYEQLDLASFEKLDFIFSYQDGIYYFQNISKSQLVTKKLISFGERFSFDRNNTSIVIKDVADAIYVKSEDNLYFRKLSSISSIFHGIDQLHREATEAETAEFLNQGFVELAGDFSSTDVKIANRKRIALALDTLNNYCDEDKRTVFAYIKDYCPELTATDKSFAVADENDLKMLLFGIEQRFYTTPVGEEKRLANSILKI